MQEETPKKTKPSSPEEHCLAPIEYTLDDHKFQTDARTSEALLEEAKSQSTFASRPEEMKLLVVVSNSGQKVIGSLSEGNYKILHEYTFPEKFVVQDDFQFDHELVAMEPVIARAFKLIEEEMPKRGDNPADKPLPSPFAMISCVGAGKTTVWQLLFNRLKEAGYAPVFVTFAKEFFQRGKDESDVTAFLRAVSTQLAPQPNIIPEHTFWSMERLGAYLDSAGRRVVLLIDAAQELSGGVGGQPSEALMRMLCQEFLTPADRLLGYTAWTGSEWNFDVLGKRNTRHVGTPQIASREDMEAMLRVQAAMAEKNNQREEAVENN